MFVSSDPNTPVVGYSGTSYVTGTPIQLGSSPALPDFSVEVTGFGANTAGPDYVGDARPDNIVSFLLTDNRFGSGFPSANLDLAGAIADWGTYCQASLIAMSLILDRQQAVGRWIEELALLTTSAVVWSGSKLKIIPYDTGSYAGNGATWTANTTAQYALGNDDFVYASGRDPVEVETPDVALATNWMSMEFLDGSNAYNPAIAHFSDQGLIDQYGTRTEPVVQAHEFTDVGVATAALSRMLLKKAYVRNKYNFTLTQRHSRLEPMDIVVLTDARSGLSAYPVRITEITENDNLELECVAEDLMGHPPVSLATQAGTGVPLDFLVDPGNANDPIIFEPPSAMTGGTLEVQLIASGGANWGGAEIFISTDGSSYASAGRIFRGARQGLLTASLPSHADPDTTNTLSVDLTESLGTLLSGTQADAGTFVTLCYVDGELISYETATLTATNQYDLTYLRRGVYGTAIGTHGIGTKFGRIGPNNSNTIFTYVYPASYIGKTIYVKLVSFNIFGQALQDEASVVAYAYTLTGAGTIIAPNNPVITSLQAGTSQDWGIVNAALIATADFGLLGLAVGLDIDLGTPL